MIQLRDYTLTRISIHWQCLHYDMIEHDDWVTHLKYVGGEYLDSFKCQNVCQEIRCTMKEELNYKKELEYKQ